MPYSFRTLFSSARLCGGWKSVQLKERQFCAIQCWKHLEVMSRCKLWFSGIEWCSRFLTEANPGHTECCVHDERSKEQPETDGLPRYTKMIVLTKFGLHSQISVLRLKSCVTSDVSRVKTVGCPESKINLTKRLTSNNSVSLCSHTDFCCSHVFLPEKLWNWYINYDKKLVWMRTSGP